jgi:hypothetical protein
MRKYILIASLFFLSPSAALADFGDADFSSSATSGGPRSYHDAWCKRIKNECRIRFQGDSMWVEGQGGIKTNQYLGYRYDVDGRETYNYIRYRSDAGGEKQALFLFANTNAQQEFLRAFLRWKKQTSEPLPNYRLPASQGVQDTQGRDKEMNPYERPAIDDWKEKTIR